MMNLCHRLDSSGRRGRCDRKSRNATSGSGPWTGPKHDWAEALEQCLAKAEQCQNMKDVVLDLRQQLEAERERKPT
jgi:hypothetical protein